MIWWSICFVVIMYIFIKILLSSDTDNNKSDDSDDVITYTLTTVDNNLNSVSKASPLRPSKVQITQDQYDEIKKCCIALRTLFRRISRNENVFDAVNGKSASVNGDVMPGFDYFNFVVKSIFIQDLKRCYEEMGHSFVFSSLSKEGQCLVLVLSLISEGSACGRYDLFCALITGKSGLSLEGARKDFNRYMKGDVNFSLEGDVEFGLSAMLQTCGGDRDDLEQYRIYLYRLVSTIAKIDGTVTSKEQDWLEKMLVINEQSPFCSQ